MSIKQPVIKFSPFEALLIGEKNKVLKRQPMKNTIFVTRLNRQRKTINLRDLFGLEKDARTDNKNDGIFKMPQSVHEFLKNRKLQSKTNNASDKPKKDILQYEFEGHKIIPKNHETLKPKGKNAKLKSNKVKFKKKFKYKEKIIEKVVRKFPKYTRRNNHCYYNSRYKKTLPRLASKNVTKRSYKGQRHSLRGTDGKFIRKSDFDNIKSTEISTKRKYRSSYLQRLYLKKNKKSITSGNETQNVNLNKCKLLTEELPSPQKQFKVNGYKELISDESPYRNNFIEGFCFPKFPQQLEPSDYENDPDLLDIIYENFPKLVRFECKGFFNDFSDALLSTDILKPEKNIKIYEKKKNGAVKDERVAVILDNQIPCLKLRRSNNIKSNHCPVRNNWNGYSSKIDEPYTKKSHLINGKNLRSLFFRSAEGKDVFIGNLVKPLFQNSWFGSLPEF